MRIIPDEQRIAQRLVDKGWTCHPPGTSCIGTPHAYAGKQDTSYAASVYMAPRSGTLRWTVLEHLRHCGPTTDVDLQRELGMAANTERPRRVELVEGGFVRDSGKTKRHHGQEHILWEAVVPMSEVGEA